MRRRNLFMSTTIMCGLLTIAFTFDKQGIHWFWSDQKPVAIVLFILTIILGVCWRMAAKDSMTSYTGHK